MLLATALFFGVFFIFPLIRTQVKEEGKLRAMTASLSARSQTLEHAALTDGLTGMQNRRYFDDALREYLDEFRRIDKPVGLMILDLDHFKQVNDTHGHDVGDEVLRAVADCLQGHDPLSRRGGAARRRGIRRRRAQHGHRHADQALPSASARRSPAWPCCRAMCG